MRPAAVVLGVLLAVSGCLSPGQDSPPASPPEHRLSGAFSSNATQADVGELSSLVEARGGAVVILESFPMQFVASKLAAVACAKLRAELAGRPYVASVGACAPVEASPDPDAPVGSRS